MRTPLLLLLAPLLLAAGPTPAPSTRPAHDRDPWIFRCVLDGNARTVVISLGDEVWAAYDANRCAMSKLWFGNVELTGPVYDTRHGPQPKTQGKQLIERPANLAPTPAAPATRPTDYVNVNGYRGYHVKDDVATLQFDFDGLKVEETPSLVDANAGDHTVTVRRTLSLAGPISADKPFNVEISTSASVRKIRVVEGAATLAKTGKPVEAPGDVPFDADSNLVLRATAPGTLVIETTFATE